MSSCEQIQELISRMLDEELTPQEAEAVRRHRENCPDCAAMYAAFQALSDTLGQDLEEPPEALRENVMAELRREEIRQKNTRRGPWRAVLTAAACVLIFVGITQFVNPRLGRKSVALTAAPQSVVTADYGAVSNSFEAAGEETAMGAAAVEDAEPAEQMAAERAAFDTAAVTGSAAANEAEVLDLSGRMDLARLQELLQGEEVDPALDPAALSPVFTLRLSDGELALYRSEGQLYYYEPVDGRLLRCACEEDALLDALDG